MSKNTEQQSPTRPQGALLPCMGSDDCFTARPGGKHTESCTARRTQVEAVIAEREQTAVSAFREALLDKLARDYFPDTTATFVSIRGTVTELLDTVGAPS